MHSASTLFKHQRAQSPKFKLTLLSLSSFHSPLPFSIPSDPQSYTNLLIHQCSKATRSHAHHPFDQILQRTHPFSICRILHARILVLSFQLNGTLGNALIDLYSKSGDLGSTQNAFFCLEKPTRPAWNSVLSAHSRQDSPESVIDVFASMHCSGARPDQFSFATVCSSLARVSDLERGRIIHCQVIKCGFDSNSFCEGSLIDMYAKCGCVSDARTVFDGIKHPDMVSWTAMISGYVWIGRAEEALQLFSRMRGVGMKADCVTFVTVITACVNLGKLEEAKFLLREMAYQNVVAWNAIISGYAQNGCEDEALALFREMRACDVKPTQSTLASVLSAVASLMALDEGRVVHSMAIRLSLHSSVFVGSSLISMYAKCHVLEDARRVFDTSYEWNIVMWNAMIGAYSQNDQPLDVMEMFLQMKGFGFKLDEFTLVSVFATCTALAYLELGRQVHCDIIKRNLTGSSFLGNAVVDMYGKLGELNDAQRQFELLPHKDNISWNAMIACYAHNDREEDALRLFQRMSFKGAKPDEASFASVISAVSNIGAFKEGTQLHCLAIKCNLCLGSYVGSSLINMYAQLGKLEDAHQVFLEMPEKNAVSRNALIAGYVQNNKVNEALDLFGQMQTEGIKASQFTFASLLPVCNGPSGLSMGKQIHCNLFKSGLLYGYDFIEVSLLCTYLKLKAMRDANSLFLDIPISNNKVLWTAVISGHTQNGYSEESLVLFQKMRKYYVPSDEATFSSVLKACADLASLVEGKEVHCLIFQMGFSSYSYTRSALIDMYSKCGDIGAAFQVFDELTSKGDIILWNPMIVGFAKSGFAEEALLLFHQILEENITPDDVTFLGILTACSHAGLVSQGRGFFVLMSKKYGINPKPDHYACMVDILGRVGYLKEAEEFVTKLPFEPDGVIWATFLSACRVYGDEIRGKHAADKLINLEPQNSSPYVLLSSIHAASRNWGAAKMLKQAMKERGVRKSPGCSWISVGNNTSSFIAEDKLHPRVVDIYEQLENLTVEMKKEGYVTELDCLLLSDVVEECTFMNSNFSL